MTTELLIQVVVTCLLLQAAVVMTVDLLTAIDTLLVHIMALQTWLHSLRPTAGPTGTMQLKCMTSGQKAGISPIS